MIRLRPFLVPAVVVLVAIAVYVLRVHTLLVDFEVYRTAAGRVLRAATLYRPDDGHYQYKYFPAFAFAMTPFALMADSVARAVWFTLTLGILAAFLRISAGLLPDRRTAVRPLLWLTVLVTGKFWVKELVLGQTNVLLGLALIGVLVAARRGRPLLAGSLAGVAIFIKPYALLFVPWLAWTVGIPAVAACGGVLLAGLLLPAARYGWHGNLEELTAWFRTVTGTTGPNLFFPENISLASMWARWLGPTRTAAILGAASGAAALAFPLVAVARRRNIVEPLYLELGLLMLLIPLLSPQGWDYVLIIAVPAMMCLIDRQREMSRTWRVVTIAAIALVSFTIFDLMGRALYQSLMSLSVVTIGTLLLIASLTHLRWRQLA